MKAKLLIFSLVWLSFITLSHISMNIGFERFQKKVRVALTEERDELIVGFLPVT
jgi:hypothetical protein